MTQMKPLAKQLSSKTVSNHSADFGSQSDAAIKACSAEQRQAELSVSEEDHLAEEVAVALVYNGISHAVMMATPCDLEDFAIGFSITEGIVEKRSDILDISLSEKENGIELNIELLGSRISALKERRRFLSGKSGCGLCGLEALDAAMPQIQAQDSVQTSIQIPRFSAVSRAFKKLPDLQVLNKRCGALHCAARVNSQGEILALREDVGRHNALDKLIGSLEEPLDQSDFIFLSSRTSYELVQKAARVQCRSLVSISAPTALAVKLCQDANINLIGFVREDRQKIYARADEQDK